MQDHDRNERRLMELFKRLHHILQRDFMRSVAPEFKHTALMILLRLHHADKRGEAGSRISELASDMGITVPAATQVVAGLEAKGMVERRMDSEDRRAVRVTLSEGGRKRLKPVFLQYSEGFKGLVESLGPSDTEELIRLLQRVETYFSPEAAAKRPHGEDPC